MSKADLHIHTTASDGRYTPEEIVSKAAELGMTIIAIADHDSVDGVEPALNAARAFPQLRVIPNVEISTEYPGGDVHVLGYFIDHTDSDLRARLEVFRNSRETRARRMLSRLREFGIQLDWPRVQEIAGEGAIGRPHIAQAMLEKEYITSLKEAFDRYLAKGRPAYVERDKFTPREAVELILRANGLPALAHPFTAGDPEKLIIELKAAGLVSIEVYYNGYTAEQIDELLQLAHRHQLIPSGGTDYHGLDDQNETMIGDVDLPMESVAQIITLARHRGLKSAMLPIFSS